MANRWGNKAVRDYFLGLQNHYRWWLQPWKDGEAWRAAIHGVAKSRTRLSDWTTTKYMAKQRLKEFGEQTPLQSKQWKETIVLCRVMISAVAQLCATLSDPMVCSTPGFAVHHQLPELAQTHVHWVGDAISSSIVPFSSQLQSFPAPGSFPRSQFFPSVAKVLVFQLQHQSFQWIFRIDFL